MYQDYLAQRTPTPNSLKFTSTHPTVRHGLSTLAAPPVIYPSPPHHTVPHCSVSIPVKACFLIPRCPPGRTPSPATSLTNHSLALATANVSLIPQPHPVHKQAFIAHKPGLIAQRFEKIKPGLWKKIKPRLWKPSYFLFDDFCKCLFL